MSARSLRARQIAWFGRRFALSIAVFQLLGLVPGRAYGQDQTVTGNLTVSGTANVSTLIAGGGGISGAAAGLTLSANGQNQNIALIPSGSGYVQINGLLGVGTSVPHYKISLGTDDDSKLALFENPGGTNMFGFGYRDDGTHMPRTQFFANGAEVMSVGLNGNVGVGTTNPTYRLSVAGTVNDGIAISANNPELIFNHMGAATNFARIFANSGASANYNGLWLASNEKPDGSQANPSLSSWALDIGGTDMALSDSFNIRRRSPGGNYSMPFVITSVGNVGIGTSTPGNNRLQIFGAVGTNDYTLVAQHGLQLRIVNGLGTYGTRAVEMGLLDNGVAVIQSNEANVGYNPLVLNPVSGDVGIGTNSPASGHLQIQTDTNFPGIFLTGNQAGWGSGIQFANTAPGGKSYGIYSSQSGAFCFSDNGVGLDRIRVESAGSLNLQPTAGYVGIATASPSAQLEVNGDTKIDGNLTVSGAFSAPGYVANNGTITGGATGLTLSAGGANQNVTITPSGSGTTVINSNVGIGVSTPANRLSVYGVASSPPTSGTTPNGIVSISNAANNNLYVGLNGAPGYGAWLQAQDITNLGINYPLLLNPNGGNVGIGTSAPDTALTVKGRVHATEVVVDATVTANDLKVQPKIWADDVFDDGRKLEPLSQVEREIKANKHLPGIPSAKDVEANGVSVAEMQAKLLGKIEELTLRMIQMEKDNVQLRAKVTALKAAQK